MENLLLSTLPQDEFERLASKFESVDLKYGDILIEAGTPIKYAYFINSGIVSTLFHSKIGITIDFSIVGYEGMVGIPLCLRADRIPYRAVVEVPGNALRIKAETLSEVLNHSSILQRILLIHAHNVSMELSQTAICNCIHQVKERFCRWLLIARDRIKTKEVPLRQEVFANMLGARRTTITRVARLLQNNGMIDYSRGKIVILDRAGLESHTCECYGIIKQADQLDIT